MTETGERATTRQRPIVPIPFPGAAPFPETDVLLMERIAGGNLVALGLLYDRFSRDVYSVARVVLGEATTAEDVTHDVFLAVWQNASSFDPAKGSVPGWLTRITRNRAIDMLRRSRGKSMVRLPDSETAGSDPLERFFVDRDPDPADQVVVNDERMRVRNALQSLKTGDRQVLEFAYFGGMTQRQIADHFGRPLGTVKSQIRVAMKRLALELEHAEREPLKAAPGKDENEH